MRRSSTLIQRGSINGVDQNWDILVMFGVNSKRYFKKQKNRNISFFFFKCSKMQYGPYDAYMEVPYKM